MTRTLLRRPGWWLDPWKELGDIEGLFDSALYGEGRRYPAVNVWTNEDEAVVSAELPGIESKDIDISVKGRTLTVKGAGKAEKEEEKAAYLKRERWTGEFSRRLELPFDVEAGKVKAAYKNGVLTITLPKAESEKPRKIALN
jgi:HSP20 family protein